MPDPQLGWSIALGPWKQLPLNLFVLWMAGNTISLFPIMMVGMMFVRPVQSLFSYKDGRSTSILSITSLATMNIPRVRCSMLFFLLFLSFFPLSLSPLPQCSTNYRGIRPCCRRWYMSWLTSLEWAWLSTSSITWASFQQHNQIGWNSWKPDK